VALSHFGVTLHFQNAMFKRSHSLWFDQEKRMQIIAYITFLTVLRLLVAGIDLLFCCGHK
jgi:hypothetical protein